MLVHASRSYSCFKTCRLKSQVLTRAVLTRCSTAARHATFFHLSINPFIHLYIFISIHPFIHLYFFQSICSFIYLSIPQSTCLFIIVSIHPLIQLLPQVSSFIHLSCFFIHSPSMLLPCLRSDRTFSTCEFDLNDLGFNHGFPKVSLSFSLRVVQDFQKSRFLFIFPSIHHSIHFASLE